MGKVLTRLLGELEHRVMIIMWTHPEPLNVGAVAQQLQRRRQLAYTTVLTIMNRLVAKGLLERSVHQPHRYSPRCSRQQYFRSAAESFFGHLRREFGPVAMACFIEEVKKSDRREIQQLLSRLKSRDR